MKNRHRSPIECAQALFSDAWSTSWTVWRLPSVLPTQLIIGPAGNTLGRSQALTPPNFVDSHVMEADS